MGYHKFHKWVKLLQYRCTAPLRLWDTIKYHTCNNYLHISLKNFLLLIFCGLTGKKICGSLFSMEIIFVDVAYPHCR